MRHSLRLVAGLFLATLLTCPLSQSTGLSAPGWAETVPAPSRQGVWPLSPRPDIVAGFDPPSTLWGAGHRGVDLRGHVGQSVHSSLAGNVIFAARIAGRGVVVVDHGGIRTTHEPVSASVQVGDSVPRGGVLGTLQRAASHCFPRACLHWGLRRGETYLDPLTLVGAGPIRLLPFGGSLGAGPAGPLRDAPVAATAARPGQARASVRAWRIRGMRVAQPH